MQSPRQAPRETPKLGRYELGAEVGRGAMGVVYRARDPIIDRVVALKTIESGRTGAAASSFTASFFQEARSAGRLSHPNIVTIYDAGEAAGKPYIAMEFLDGTSLREMLDAGGALSVHRAIEIAGQVARALGYAHENGVVHRDVKPGNIIVLRNRRPKITDFGIARLGEADVLAGARAGSPKYMSPEQIRGDADLDGRSDIFSLGAVLYELLTGRAPFAGADVAAIMRSVLEDVPAPPSALDPRVPPALDALVLRMLAKRPEERLSSARSLFRELRKLEESLDKDTAEPERAERGVARVSADDPTIVLGAAAHGIRRVARRHPARYAAIAAVLAIVGIAGGVAMRQHDPPAAAAVAAPASPPAAFASATVVPAATPTDAPGAQADPPGRPAQEVKPADAASPARPTAKPKAAAKSAAPASVVAPSPAPEPAAVHAAAPQPPPPPAPAKGRLILAVSPWGEIYIDGKLRGTTPPLAEIELPPGRHRLEIRNSAQLPFLTTVEVEAGDTQRIQHRFAN